MLIKSKLPSTTWSVLKGQSRAMVVSSQHFSHRDGLAAVDYGDVTPRKSQDVLACDICSFCAGVGRSENIQKGSPLLFPGSFL